MGKAQPSLQNPGSRDKAELAGGLKYLRKLDSNQIYAGFRHLPFLLVFHKIEMITEEKFIISPRQNIVFPWKKAERPFKPRNVYGGLFQTAASQLAPHCFTDSCPTGSRGDRSQTWALPGRVGPHCCFTAHPPHRVLCHQALLFSLLSGSCDLEDTLSNLGFYGPVTFLYI